MNAYAGMAAPYVLRDAQEAALTAAEGIAARRRATIRSSPRFGPTGPGIEMQVILTSRAKAKHPNAARLFANYILSPEGNKVFNDDPGGVTVYDTAGLPKGYQPPKAGVFSRREEIAKLFGT